ncbi:protein tramtrack, alpha isoform-like [Planococcus citri]|uniref:protein tramtrack, alpha isoform-like n=1 Tax=Planococcus citri TaxID=170843 RepID=UPI0031F8B0B2
MCSQPAAGKMETPQQYCLRWKYHHSNLQAMFSQLLERECFCDVTLACEGKTLKAHKVMLSACSTYFDSIFSQYEENNPIVILKDVKFSDIKALVQFMYKGEINVDNSELTSLLKTAEELRIKGLAEVSWRSDREMEAPESGDEDLDQPQPKRLKSEPYSPKSGQNTITSLSSRDDYNESHDDAIDEDGDDGSENECSTGMWDTDRSSRNDSHFDDSIDVKPSAGALSHNRIQSNNYATNMQPQPPNLVNTQNTIVSPQVVTSSSVTGLSAAAAAGCAIGGAVPDDDKCSVTSASAVPGNTPYSAETASTAASVDLSQYPDIMKMNDYLESGGRRPQFWEEPFTKRLMEAIKNKELEMKVAAELMGVSYGTLYGRYRDAYGCLKHPYRVRDFWSEQGPAEVLAKLQRKELTLFRAAEMLNVTVTTLANYLSTLRQGGGTGSSDNEDVSDNEDMVIDEDKVSTHSSSTTHSSIHNNPDITIVKKENLANLNGN